ncbi:MAG: serine/threonine-protein kinase [Solirubrobacteraceae bacterium]|nr:serine/threonine-protein kinase [Solirubrobacteraceae bacterium]
MPLASGLELPERYRVRRHVASGGMASVWEVDDLLLGRTVAVKVLGAQYAADPGARARFQREARTAARVSDHPHIATIYDTGEHGAEAFIVMEYFSGGTVADRLRAAAKDDQPIPRETALRWLHEAAAALDGAHAAGIVHRDVKPANLLIDANDRLAVGDFGIARLADDTQMTMTGQVLGTAAYLSPEQALGRPATAASDRYALAVVAYELLTGTRPFAGGPATAQARQHAEAQPDRASVAAPGLPRTIDAVFAHSLAKRPDERPSTAAQLVDELGRALRTPHSPAAGATTDATRRQPPIAAQPTSPTRVSAPAPRRHATVAAGVGAGATAGAETGAAKPPPGEGRGVSRFVPIGLTAAVVGGVIALALSGTGGDDDNPRPATSGAAQSDAVVSRTQTTPPASAAPAQTPDPSPPPAAPPAEDPAALNERGFQLIRAGDPAAAVAPLRSSVAGYRNAGRTDELNYAYALFNLATALAESGDPAAAIPLFEERLTFSNQRGTVRRALQEAQARLDGGGDREGRDVDDGARRDSRERDERDDD